ncbi:hypothetical protein Y710_10855 [Gordonia sp. QH-12]|uniref:Uncharacterized protein n=2 Tax=Gordoniaceae TaxID=85026 RepID=L7LMT7_9ACTN|nr:hypothetical protein UG54_03780 [Gordonia sihwensis]KXT56978.1 hypothetical protein Y710_10855 [Gordonia sp. QH-12]GAC61353.1 hypothetical protein GSI01S_16_00780 [Gordonia sihwensis NBRC 108236]
MATTDDRRFSKIMVPSAKHRAGRPAPEPPYSTELLADLHADALEPEVAAHVRSRLAADPHAAQVLAALDRVQTELRERGQSAAPMPDAIAARLDSVIDRLTGG